MLLDKQNAFSEAQIFSLAGFGTPVVSTNAIDLQGGGAVFTDTLGNTLLADPGRTKLVEILIQVVTTVTSGGASTITFDLCTSTAADQSTGLVVHQSTPVIALATLVAGYQFRIEVPPGIPATGRYLFVRYTVGTANVTAGAFTAALIVDKQTNIAVL